MKKMLFLFLVVLGFVVTYSIQLSVEKQLNKDLTSQVFNNKKTDENLRAETTKLTNEKNYHSDEQQLTHKIDKLQMKTPDKNADNVVRL